MLDPEQRAASGHCADNLRGRRSAEMGVDWRLLPSVGRSRVVVGSFSSRPCVDAAPIEKNSEGISPMATGTVKKVISDRGFGFITADAGKDYFFHRDALDSSIDFDRLVGGEQVSFEVESSPRGPRASKVSATSA